MSNALGPSTTSECLLDAPSSQESTRLRRRLGRFGAQYAFDVASWAVAIGAAGLLRLDFDVARMHWESLLLLAVIAAVLQGVVGSANYLYRGRFTYGTFEEVRSLAIVVTTTGVMIAAPVALFGHEWGVPRSTGLIAIPIALVFTFSIRYLKRLYVELRFGPGASSVPTLIFGAGYLGERLARHFVADPSTTLWPVGFIDDDPHKRHLQVNRVRVKGTLDQLTEVVNETGAKALVVAIGRADAALLRQVQDVAERLDLHVKVMPPIEDMLDHEGKVAVNDLRDLSIEDLLGRAPHDTDVQSVAGYLRGRRVLVTGAGGSIGAELCAQIIRFEPAELIMLDRDETALQQVQFDVAGHGLLDTKDVVLADIRDAAAMQRVFCERRPDVVFHAAALKHLPMLEQYPVEGWKTNVLGTLNVLEAARSVGVTTFVNVSTDKAANPTSVLGHSKRMAEKLTSWMGEVTGERYLSVRFGNVIGSRGSMLPTFTRLIEQGGPLTVTHPDVTRFFMTIPEACQLVLQAGGIGGAGEVLILDMGTPVRILDIAERMIAISGRDVEIVFTGLRAGEKLHEELFASSESTRRPFHPKISHACVEPFSKDRLSLDDWLARMWQEPRNNDTQAIQSLEVASNA